MKKYFTSFILVIINIFVFTSCSYVLNVYMNNSLPPKILPGDISMASEHWYMKGYYDSEKNLLCDYASIDWTESEYATKYNIYYYSSETEDSFSVAQSKSIFLESVLKSGEYTISFREKNIILDYYNNYTYITVIPITEQYIEQLDKVIENKGKPLTRYWTPCKLK